MWKDYLHDDPMKYFYFVTPVILWCPLFDCEELEA